MIKSYNINGQTIWDSPTLQTGVMVIKDNIDNNGNNYNDKIINSANILLYKKVTRPGEPEQWSFPFMFVPYGKTMKETAAIALSDICNCHILEDMLSEQTGIFKFPFIDDSHTSYKYNYSPVSVLYTYQVDTDKSFDFLYSLYKTLKDSDFVTDSYTVRSRAESINERYIVSKAMKNYINNQLNSSNKGVEDINWFHPSEITELIEQGKLDKSSGWLWEQVIRKMTF